MSAPLDHTMLAVTFKRYPDAFTTEKVPQHISVMPWFPDRPHLGIELRDIIRKTTPFTVVRGEPMDLGEPGHEKEGMSVLSEGLVALHKRLFAHFVSRGIEFSRPQWLGEGYNPHYALVKGGVDPFDVINELNVTGIAVIRNVYDWRRDRGNKIINYEQLRSRP